MWAILAFSAITAAFTTVALLNRRRLAGALGILGAALPWLVVAVGGGVCRDRGFVCGSSILVALVYTAPVALGFALAAAVGALRGERDAAPDGEG